MKKTKFKGWTNYEEQVLFEAIEEGKTSPSDVNKLSKMLKRKPSSVASKLWRFKKGIYRKFPKDAGKEWVKSVPKTNKRGKKLNTNKLAKVKATDNNKKIIISNFKQIIVEDQTITIYLF